MKIGVLGAGAFGTALAKLLESKGHEVKLWAFLEEEARQINETRQSLTLPGVFLGPRVHVSSDLENVVSGLPILVGVTPIKGIRPVLKKALPHLHPKVILVNGSKGLEMESFQTVSQMYQEVLPEDIAHRAVFMSGPTFAKELAAGLPAALVAASQDPESLRVVRKELSTPNFRIFSSKDPMGVCLAGALKNVYAIATGVCDSLGYGLNARAATISRALAEMSHLGKEMGADPMTFLGLAGIGDLVLTCTGDLSRNRRFGLALGKGEKMEEIIKKLNGIAEGVYTAKAINQLSHKLHIKLPIAHLVYRALYEGLDVKKAVHILLSLETSEEFTSSQ